VGEAQASLSPVTVEKVIGKLQSYKRGGETYQSRFNKEGMLDLSSIIPGNYRFEYFVDSDSNGEWSPGIVSPFKPAEWFSVMPETLIVRSRWTTDVGTVTVPENKR